MSRSPPASAPVIVLPSVEGPALAAALTSAGVRVCEDATQNPWALQRGVCVVLARPGEAVMAAQQHHGLTPVAAQVYAARCFAGACAALAEPGAFSLDAEGPDFVDELTRRWGVRPLPARRRAPMAEADATALAIYESAPPRPGGKSLWARELFRWGDAPEAPCPAVLDITGRARILVFGPHLHLPPGRWRLSASFHLCRDAARSPLRLECGAGARLAHLDFQPDGAGVYRVALDCELDEPAPFEMRLSVLRAALHGELRFHDAEVTFLSSRASSSSHPSAPECS